MQNKLGEQKTKAIRDIFIIALSCVIGVVLLKTDAIKHILPNSPDLEFFTIFIAGIFFTSVFTTIPATIALAELSAIAPLHWVVVIGALGALFGDYIIFRFFRDNILEDFKYLISLKTRQRWTHIFKSRIFKAFITLIGGIIIASPLPDELGLALMGATKTNTFTFAIISLVCNAAGIFIIVMVARVVL